VLCRLVPGNFRGTSISLAVERMAVRCRPAPVFSPLPRSTGSSFGRAGHGWRVHRGVGKRPSSVPSARIRHGMDGGRPRSVVPWVQALNDACHCCPQGAGDRIQYFQRGEAVSPLKLAQVTERNASGRGDPFEAGSSPCSKFADAAAESEPSDGNALGHWGRRHDVYVTASGRQQRRARRRGQR
jgi:hypothetical protein